MMDAPALFAEVQADTDDYLLDLDADPGVDDFDFKLDGVYDTGAVDALLETGGEPGGDAHDDLEIGGNDEETHEETREETHVVIAQEEYAETKEEAQDGGADAIIEYQDEIGYEDDESALPDASNIATEEASVPRPEPSADTQDVHGQQDVSEPQEEEYDEEEEVGDENKAPDALDGPLQQEDAACQDEDGGFQDNDDGGPGAVDSAHESTHQSEVDHGTTPASNLDDFENADSDASDSSTMDLDIVVHYNQGQYALVGEPTADPDTYFFSDEKVLTWPLSHFLASIRTVISDEVSAGDELCIRIESLDFEFGEKSSKKFLDRSFFDIIKCFVGLAGNSRLASKDSSTLNLALMVRRDCENHFCELLAEAGLAHDEGDEDLGEANSGDEAHHESPADEDHEGYDLEPETAGATAEGEGQDDVEQNGDGVEMYFAEAFEDMDDTMGDQFDLEMGMPEPTEQPGAEAGDEQNAEEHGREDQQDGHGGADATGHEERAAADEPGDDDVDFSADLGGDLGAEPTTEESELAGDAPDQTEEGVNNDWYEETGAAGEDIGVEEVNTTNLAGGATTEQGSTQNDVDFGYTVDLESGLSTTFDGHGDFDTAFEADLGQASMNNSHLITTEPNRIGSASNHTSRTSTVIGDEVETQGSSLLDSTFNDVQYGTESQGDRDEIDWENDGDETEEQPTQPQTTNSPSGKRTRTNEPESLDEEADYKRRRT